MKIIAAYILCSNVHIIILSLVGWFSGVGINEISLGFGPVLYRKKFFVLKALFILGGYVDFFSLEKNIPNIGDKLQIERKSLLMQIFIYISACFTFLFLSFSINPELAASSFFPAFYQIFSGAISPFSKAQQYLSSIPDILKMPFGDILIIITMKQTAVSLLPLAGLNGGSLLYIMNKSLLNKNKTIESLLMLTTFILFLLLFSWIAALIYYQF